MKGIVLAGGTGSRLFPLTKITNKHLLPIYDKPMIYYPIQTLVDAGITDILLVTGGRNSGDFLRLLGNGKEFGLKHLNYTYQEGEGGIAEALALAEHFADGDQDLRDPGRQPHRRQHPRRRSRSSSNRSAARAFFLKEVPDAERFGVAELDGNRIVGIEEKPKKPKSNYAVTGIYLYDGTVFEKCRELKPSRPRRAGNHRRQQRLHSRRHHDLLDPRRLVDRRRHLRIAAARGKPGRREVIGSAAKFVESKRGLTTLSPTCNTHQRPSNPRSGQSGLSPF